MPKNRRSCLVVAVAALGLGLAVPGGTASAADTAELTYTAIGSSFAAGPGIPSPRPSAPAACGRSTNNYPSVLARELGAKLVDASCGGATTANVLTSGQAGQPPQADQITADTKLVTVTIGGNDVNYLGSLEAYSCQESGGSGCGSVDTAAIDRTFTDLPNRLRNVVTRVREKAPQALVMLVTYFTVLPDSGACTGVPLSGQHLEYERSIGTRLATATKDTAAATGVRLVDLGAASHGHDACAADPWVEKYTVAAGKSRYHPNATGMRAAGRVIESVLAGLSDIATGTVRSALPGKCATVAAAAPVDGTAVQLNDCGTAATQQWAKTTLAPQGALRSLNGCLDVKDSGTADFTPVRWWSCNGSAAQRWVHDAQGQLVNPNSGRCLDVPNSSTQNGTALQLFDCNGTAAQRWTTAG